MLDQVLLLPTINDGTLGAGFGGPDEGIGPSNEQAPLVSTALAVWFDEQEMVNE